jgi:5''/3''-nucleotidase SurE
MKKNTKPLILITNDDNYRAKGLHKLASLMKSLGDVVVISTEKTMSAKGHSITTSDPIRVKQVNQSEGYKEYICNGTPVDCVKIGYQRILERKPDLVVSGVNHGSNASVNVVYSGTMGAVVEACMDGIPAIGFSLDCYDADADFDHLDEYIIQITKKVLDEGLPHGVCLNINFPVRSEEPIKGIKVCRQAKALWSEAFEERTDPHGGKYYWLTGDFICQDTGDDTDYSALQNNYISLVPTQYDWTAKKFMNDFKKYEQIKGEK